MAKKVFCGLLAVILMIGFQTPQPVEAAGKFVVSRGLDTPIKVKGASFTARRDTGSRNIYSIVREKNGKSTTILSGVEVAFVTNGDILYYSKPIKRIDGYTWRNTIYCYNIKTKKSKKIASGANFGIRECSGKYLYCGNEIMAAGVNLYAVNVKTKKKRHMVNVVGSINIANGKVLTTTNAGSIGNDPIHVFNLNGSGKKKIADGCHATIKNGKIYYARWSMKKKRIKVYQCSLKGNHKKAVTKWVKYIPTKYL